MRRGKNKINYNFKKLKIKNQTETPPPMTTTLTIPTAHLTPLPFFPSYPPQIPPFGGKGKRRVGGTEGGDEHESEEGSLTVFFEEGRGKGIWRGGERG